MRRELFDFFRRTQPGALDLNNMNNLDALAAAFNCRRCGSIATARIPAGGRQLCRQALRSRSHHNSRCWHKVCQRGIRHVASEEDANNASGGRPRTGRPCPKCELCLELCHAFVPFARTACRRGGCSAADAVAGRLALPAGTLSLTRSVIWSALAKSPSPSPPARCACLGSMQLSGRWWRCSCPC
jgi:hypothetical protein